MEIEAFTAIDFETALPDPNSICQVGMVRMVDGEIAEKVNQLICPPKNRYFHKNIEIHKIRPEDTKDAPSFAEFWPKIRHLIEGQVVVAHNSGFDVNCLRSTLAHYEMDQPEFEERCTRVIYGRGLAYLSKKYKINLNHHDAYSDAHACAQLYIKHLQRQNLPKTGSLFPGYLG